MSLWMVSEAPKKDGYFLIRERQDGDRVVIDHADVFYKRKEDAERACSNKNDLIIDLKERRRKEKENVKRVPFVG